MTKKPNPNNLNFLLENKPGINFSKFLNDFIPSPNIFLEVYCPDCSCYMMESPILVDGTREFVCSYCDKIIYEAKYTKPRRKSKYAVADNIIKLER